MKAFLHILREGYLLATREEDVRVTTDEGSSPWWLVVMLDGQTLVGAKWFHDEAQADIFVLRWKYHNPNLFGNNILFPGMVTGE